MQSSRVFDTLLNLAEGRVGEIFEEMLKVSWATSLKVENWFGLELEL